MDSSISNTVAPPVPERSIVLSTMVAYLQPGKLVPLLAIVAAIAFGVGLFSWAEKQDMVPLMPGLAQQDTAQVIDYLNSRNQPFTVDSQSGLILVASDKARQLQVELAGLGLPQSQLMGLELLRQDQPLGTSQFMEQARYQHALETELARTVSSMRNVDTARIHLAIPKRSVFVRRQSSASASVMVKMLPGRTLESGQVRAIINLVGSSVPYLDSANVTIVDEWGSLLSSESGNELAEITAHQFEFARKLETHYSQRIEDLLVPLIGQGRVRASVSADIDFSVEEQTAESFEGDPAKIRSEQEQRQNTGGANATGVPGALTNQPPAADAADGANAEEGQISNLTRNYELDKRISHTRNAPGKINKLSAAVVIDNIRSFDEAGEPVNQPATAAELEQFTALVRGAIGYDEERGDSILVFNQPFQVPDEIEPLEAAPVWEKPWIWTLARQIMAGLIILAVILFIIKPALVSLQPAQLAAAGGVAAIGNENKNGIEDDSVSLSQQGLEKSGNLVNESHGDILLMARTMARDDPKRVARLVKDWVAEEKKDA